MCERIADRASSSAKLRGSRDETHPQWRYPAERCSYLADSREPSLPEAEPTENNFRETSAVTDRGYIFEKFCYVEVYFKIMEAVSLPLRSLDRTQSERSVNDGCHRRL